LIPGNVELLQVLVHSFLTLPPVVLVIRRDERRLEGERLARAWPAQSRDAAIFNMWQCGLHPLCVLVHFVRTRRNLSGALVGVAWVTAIGLADVGAQLGVAAAVDWLGL
jgi:hypothetical protein